MSPLGDLLSLAVALWGSFARPFVVLPPSGKLVLYGLHRNGEFGLEAQGW